MQLLSRLMDRVLAARGARVTIVAATSGDTGGAAVEAFRGAERVDAIVLFPQGRISDVQRRMMTTATEPNVHAVAIEGTFDDCQALVKAMFNDLAFRDRVQLAAVNSINWGRIVAQLTYYFVAGAALGGPQPAHALLGADRQLRRRVRRLVRQGHRPAGGAAGDRNQRERHPPPRVEHRHVLAVGRGRDHVPLDGHPDLLQLRALPVRGRRARRCLRARQNERVAPKPVDRPRRGDGALPRGLHRRTRRSERRRRLHPAGEGGERLSARPPQRVRGRCRAQDAHGADPAHPPHRPCHRASREVPRRHRRHHRRAPGPAAAARNR